MWVDRGEAVLLRKYRKTLMQEVAFELHLEDCRGVSQAEKKEGDSRERDQCVTGLEEGSALLV